MLVYVFIIMRLLRPCGIYRWEGGGCGHHALGSVYSARVILALRHGRDPVVVLTFVRFVPAGGQSPVGRCQFAGSAFFNGFEIPRATVLGKDHLCLTQGLGRCVGWMTKWR